ncbi:MAG: hypothetical protein P8Y67_12700, partial [Alphaproteobacteria bacterium]
LFTTGHITLPLPYASHILSIKLGELPYETVTEEIEQLLVEVENAAAASNLPEAPDLQFIEDLVARAYENQVCGERRD